MSLNDKAMLVYLNISFWTARKYDKRVSQEIERQYNADEAGRYNKVLIAKEHLVNIRKIISSARNFHYENTLPWDDHGGRLLPTTNYFDYISGINKFQDEFERETSNFLQVYPSLKQTAHLRLNTLFEEEDYPDVETLKTKFAFTNQIIPVPDADDFRVDLNSDEVDSIRDSIEQRIQDSTEAGYNDLWKRLFKVVGNMSERLKDPENKFKNSLVSNIEDLCELLPKLNITHDPELNTAVDEIRSRLTMNDPQTLRDNSIIRNKTAIEAQKILNKMRPYQIAA
jgi:hypothetical protein